MKRVVIGLIGVVVLAAVAGGAFYGGMKYGQNQVIENPLEYLAQEGAQVRQFAGRQFTEGEFPAGPGAFFGTDGTPQPGARGAFRVSGIGFDTVQSVEGDVVTVSRDDGLVRVLTTDTTLIQKYQSVSVDALEPGDQVIVSGTTNDDGSITARSIRSITGMEIGPQE